MKGGLVFIIARKVFNKEYKINAVKMVKSEQYSVKHARRILNIHPNTLHRWISEYLEFGEEAFSGNGNNKYHEHYKMRTLEKENETLKKEIELLKKYQVFLKNQKK